MANPPFNYDTANPGDSDFASQHPAEERAFRDTVSSFNDQEHYKSTGRHKFPSGDDIARNGLSDVADGMAFIRTDKKIVEWRIGGAWVCEGIENGAKPVFFQAAAPYGFVQDTSVNDRVLRVVSGSGGGTGGSWAISGMTIGGTAVSTDQMPLHSHGIQRNVYGNYGTGGSKGGIDSIGPGSDVQTNTTGGGQTHTHSASGDGSWRPAYADCIVCTKS